MAPTPVDVQPASPEPSKPADKGGIGTPSIVGISVFAFFGLCFLVTFVAFYFHRRAERNKLPPEKRPTSYRPFRTASSDKSGLLANAAPSPEEDKSSMFSRDRGSSLSLYVDTDLHNDRRKRASMDTVSLIPLHVTPAEEVHDPLSRTESSVGSGVSSISRYSVDTGRVGSLSGSLGGTLSVRSPEEEDLGVRKTRPRSTSSTSVRYYGVTPTDPMMAPQIPKIVHTPSD